MNIIASIQFLLGIGFLLAGLFMFAVELIGVFKFKYVLNRMHAAAMGDTIGLGLCLVGLIILCGFNYTSLKMALIIVFLWLASPVSSHLIARLEVTTNEEIEKFCERRDLEVVEPKSKKNDGREQNLEILKHEKQERNEPKGNELVGNEQEGVQIQGTTDLESLVSQGSIKSSETEENSSIKKSQSKVKTKMQTKKNKKGKGKR